MTAPDAPDEHVDLGEDVTSQVTIRKPTGMVISARLEPDLAERVLDWSANHNKRVSQLVREAIVAYLDHLDDPERHFGFDTSGEHGLQIREQPAVQVDIEHSPLRIG